MTPQEQITKLNTIIEKLKDIHQFVGDPYYNINKSILEINQRVSMNAKKVEQYRALKKAKKQSVDKHVDLGLDISSENFVIINQKQELVDFYIKDIYERIETIGTSIKDQSKILIDIVARLDKLEK